MAISRLPSNWTSKCLIMLRDMSTVPELGKADITLQGVPLLVNHIISLYVQVLTLIKSNLIPTFYIYDISIWLPNVTILFKFLDTPLSSQQSQVCIVKPNRTARPFCSDRQWAVTFKSGCVGLRACKWLTEMLEAVLVLAGCPPGGPLPTSTVRPLRAPLTPCPAQPRPPG